MKTQGVNYMEVILISVSVFAAGILVISKMIVEPKEEAEVSASDRLKIQINSLENKVKAFTNIEARFQKLESGIKDLSEVVDHVQNLAENGENFMKANQHEIGNIKDQLKQFGGEINQIDKEMKQVPDIVKVRLEELKKPIIAQIQQTRAHRPVMVSWKKYRSEDGKFHWTMTDKTVEYSRAEYLKKLKAKQKKK